MVVKLLENINSWILMFKRKKAYMQNKIYEN